MNFTSVVFLFVFLPATLVAYWLARSPKGRNGVLIAASLVFYAWGEPRLFWLPTAFAAASFCLGWAIERARGARFSGWLLAIGVSGFVLSLAWHKYSGFLAENANVALAFLGFGPIALGKIALPLGISFVTFNCISYLVDVHGGQVAAEKRPSRMFLAVLFFPCAAAGPIFRFRLFAAALENRAITLERFEDGVFRFAVGWVKKAFFASQLAQLVSQVEGLEAQTHASAWLAAVAYTLQIYFDFSGYSDMAIGVARLFGFVVPENFKHPYVSRSATEFWRRWHVTLSEWIRDYVFFPVLNLGRAQGQRTGKLRFSFAMVFAMTISGLWHGAAWTFVAWGLYYGFLMAIEQLFVGKLLARLPRLVSHLYSLLVIVVGFEVFRATSLTVAARSIARLFTFDPGAWRLLSREDLIFNYSTGLILSISCLAALPIREWLGARWVARERGAAWLRPLADGLRFATIALALLVGAVMTAKGTHQSFIYARF